MEHGAMKAAERILLVMLPALLMQGACGRHRDAPVAAADNAPPALIVARGRVDIEGGPLPLGMTVDGVIATVAVMEGESVKQGQLLITTDPTPAHLDENLAQARLAQAQAQVGLLESKAAAARVRAARLVEAAKEDAGDGQSADDAREAAAEAVAELANARAGMRIAHADVERTGYQATQHLLRAPLDGEVLRVTAWPGMRVSAQGGPLLTLLPAKARIVRAELGQDFVDDVAPGAQAQVISDDGRQTPLGPAHVLRIGRTFGQSTLQEDPLQRINERSVECVLAFDSPSTLRVGKRVLVRFPQTGQGSPTASERLAKPPPRTL
jgi:multidrug efflux pump subunit AcrA (membrane-fusion protein)